MVKSTAAMNFTDTSRDRIVKDTANTIVNLKQTVDIVKQESNEFKKHLSTTNNNFSLDTVNTITKEYIRCLNKVNFTIDSIISHTDEIKTANNYATVLRPIFENKYTDNNININGYVVIADAEPVKLIHFYEPDRNWDNKQSNPWVGYRTKCETDGYNKFISLKKNNPSQPYYYVLIPYDWDTGIKISFFVYIPDILVHPTGTHWIKIVSGFNFSSMVLNYDKISQLPISYIQYIQQIEDAFNMFSNNTTSNNPTTYQFGDDNKFNTLKVITSTEYPHWAGKYITECYIPGSNIDMPNIIYQINHGLNRNYTGMHDGQIVIVDYVIGSVYYTGIIKMIMIQSPNYNGLGYQIESINVTRLFTSSVNINGDTTVQGNINVVRYNGDSIISTDNTRKVTTFHDKVGINQLPYEINGLLDIDNMTQQGVLDLFSAFVPSSTNSYDIIQIINQLQTRSSQDISGLFQNDSSLFNYTNQCTVFSVPIKPIVSGTDINTIHSNTVGTHILSSDYTLKRIQQCVKEINQMRKEIVCVNDPNTVYSYIELVSDIDTKWYILSMRAILENNSSNNMVFVMTYLDANTVMVNPSTNNVLMRIINYASIECRFMNYVTLLFKCTNTTSDGGSNNGYFDASGNLAKDISGNLLIKLAIQNNEYFSSRLGLLPESYIFVRRHEDGMYILHEGNPHWNGRLSSDCWNNDSNVGIVTDIINKQLDVLYNNRQNSIFVVNYVWNSFRKISFSNKISIGNTTYVIGSGFNLNSLLDQSMIVHGDSTLGGNFYVNDSNNNNIFKVDNVTKTISNLYKVGVGMAELPQSILDVKDTTVSEIQAEVDASVEQYIIMNTLIPNLRTAQSDASFNDIITNLNITQTVNNYFGIYRINEETFLSTDITVVYHYLYRNWHNKTFGNIDDPVNHVPVKISIQLYQNILDEDTIYDGRMCFRLFHFVFGWKLLRIICFKNEITNNMYFLLTGTNIQNYGIRYNSNNNLQRLFDQRLRSPRMLAEIDRRIRSQNGNIITPCYNINEGLNSFNVMNKTYIDISMNQFKIDLNKTDGRNIIVTKITVPLSTTNDISFDTPIQYVDLSYNDRVKFSNLYTNIITKYTNIQPGHYFILRYDDLTVDYIAAGKCIDVSGNNFTLIINEFSIQDCIHPSLNVSGDTKIIGDLIISNQTNNTNFVSIDPVDHFVGINTDERNINYQNMVYSTTTDKYTPKHNVYVTNDSYPVMVSERICEDITGSDVSNNDHTKNDYSKFGTYSALNVKRKSKMYDYNTINSNAANLDAAFKAKYLTDTVTHMRYGPDISFEVCDKYNNTVELGQLQMTIDGINTTTNNLQCGFGVSVNDYDKGSKFEDMRRNILYVDNSSTLFVKQINLNGGILSTDASGNLLWNNNKIALL